jgi:hypothetical protein
MSLLLSSRALLRSLSHVHPNLLAKLLRTQHRSIIPIAFQIPLKPLILLLNHILPNIRQEEETHKRTQNAQAAGYPEGVLALFDKVIASGVDE